jgi:hypothetical protein
MIQPQALNDGPTSNMPVNAEDFSDLLEGDNGNMFSAQDMIMAIAQGQQAVDNIAADTTSAISDCAIESQSFDASPEADVTQSASDSAAELAASTIVGADDRVSRQDLVNLLEGFVGVLKAEPAANSGTAIEAAREFSVAIVNSPKLEEAQVNDRTQEIESLRNLVIEAQDTIIKLLTDRVEDRAKIAALQTQVTLLPDLQAQADRAMAAANKTEDYKNELTKIKFEMDRFKLFRVRTEEQNNMTLWARLRRWVMRRPAAPVD